MPDVTGAVQYDCMTEAQSDVLVGWACMDSRVSPDVLPKKLYQQVTLDAKSVARSRPKSDYDSLINSYSLLIAQHLKCHLALQNERNKIKPGLVEWIKMYTDAVAVINANKDQVEVHDEDKSKDFKHSLLKISISEMIENSKTSAGLQDASDIDDVTSVYSKLGSILSMLKTDDLGSSNNQHLVS